METESIFGSSYKRCTSCLLKIYRYLTPQNVINFPIFLKWTKNIIFLRQEKTIFFSPTRFNPSHEKKVSEFVKRVFYLAPGKINGRNIEMWRGRRGKEGSLLMRKRRKVSSSVRRMSRPLPTTIS